MIIKSAVNFSKYIVISVLVVFYTVTPGWAVQAHGGAEGLVSHQIGHFLFISGMVYLLYRLYHIKISGPGWLQFKIFIWLLVLWNVLTFLGHWMREFVNNADFVKDDGQIIAYTADSLFDIFFYVTRLDHLLLVPALLFLFLALRKWSALS